MILKTKGMHCNGCEALMKDIFEEEGATNVSANHKTGIIKYENLEEKRAIELVKSEGYEVV